MTVPGRIVRALAASAARRGAAAVATAPPIARVVSACAPGPGRTQRANAGNGGDQLAHASILRSADRGCRAPSTHRAAKRDLVLGQRPRAQQHPVVVDARDQRRVAAAQARRRTPRHRPGPGSIATAGPGSSSSGSAPPPAAAGISVTRARGETGQLGGAGRQHLGREFEHLQHGDAARRRRVQVQLERRLEAGQAQLVDPQRPGQRMRAACARRGPSRRRGSPPGGRPAACRPRSRSARRPRRSNRRTSGSSPSTGRLRIERARAEVVDDRHAEPHQLAQRRALHEPAHAEVGLVDAQDGGGGGADGRA